LTTAKRSLYRIAQEKQSYKNMLYLLLSFPLGLCYFVILVPTIVLGIGTLIIWIGVPILILVMIAWWYAAAFERHHTMSLLQVSIAPMGSAAPDAMQWWRALPARLSNRMTWKTLLYLLLKFPFGLVSFILIIVLPVLSIAITLVALVIYVLTAPFVALVVAMRGVPRPGRSLQRYFVFAASAFGLSLITLHLFNGLAFLAGQLACHLLGMSEAAMRLEEANALAAQERERAEQAEQRRRQLVVNVSHELRAPVASIAGHLESLLLATEAGNTALPPPTLYNYLAIAHQETLRLGQLVDELLSLARMEAGELRLDIQEIVANEVIEEVYQMLMPLAQRERRVTLVRGLLPNSPLVQADQQRLKQVLLNLVRNAITSTPAGGIVSITLEPADTGHLALIVEDNGVGMPAEELPHIFERFYRTDASHSRHTGGFGLGLAIVHDLVTAMGGSINVTSAVGQGTRFCVLLRSSTPVRFLSTNSPI
jgi:two-component system phosphate regulon sensor histidine kinase PhoR